MKKQILVILMLALIVCLSACSGGTIIVGSSDALAFPAYIAIEAPKQTSAKETASIKFYYGHDGEKYELKDTVTKIVIQIIVQYAVVEVEDYIDEPSYIEIELYKEEFEDFYSEENLCNVKKFTLFSSDIDFSQSISLDIDFNNIPYNSGYIFMRIMEYNSEYTPEGFYNTISDSIGFYKDGDSISFARLLNQIM